MKGWLECMTLSDPRRRVSKRLWPDDLVFNSTNDWLSNTHLSIRPDLPQEIGSTLRHIVGLSGLSMFVSNEMSKTLPKKRNDAFTETFAWIFWARPSR